MLGSFPLFWAVLLLPPYNRYILSSHSLIKLPFHRPAHTIDFATSPFKQMCSLPLLPHRAGTRRNILGALAAAEPRAKIPLTLLQAARQALALHLPGSYSVHSIPWNIFLQHQAKTTKN